MVLVKWLSRCSCRECYQWGARGPTVINEPWAEDANKNCSLCETGFSGLSPGELFNLLCFFWDKLQWVALIFPMKNRTPVNPRAPQECEGDCSSRSLVVFVIFVLNFLVRECRRNSAFRLEDRDLFRSPLFAWFPVQLFGQLNRTVRWIQFPSRCYCLHLLLPLSHWPTDKWWKEVNIIVLMMGRRRRMI